MRKITGLALLAGLIAGCQMTPDSYMVGPTLNPPVFGGRADKPIIASNNGNQDKPGPTLATPAGTVPKSWIPQAKLRDWQYIVIHHSDTDVGSAKAFDNAHRARGWDGLGYDFVIGNGSLTGDGAIEVGSRWTRQAVGAHAGVALYNEKGIGICLVGNFMDHRPTSAQMQSLAKLTGYLMKTYNITPDRVIGHRDAKKGGTLCPGKYMDLNVVRRMASQYAVMDGADDAVFGIFAHGNIELDDYELAFIDDSHDEHCEDERHSH